jgi:hypothetical protein
MNAINEGKKLSLPNQIIIIAMRNKKS